MNFSPHEENSAFRAYNAGSRVVVTWCDYRRFSHLGVGAGKIFL